MRWNEQIVEFWRTIGNEKIVENKLVLINAVWIVLWDEHSDVLYEI